MIIQIVGLCTQSINKMIELTGYKRYTHFITEISDNAIVFIFPLFFLALRWTCFFLLLLFFELLFIEHNLLLILCFSI